MYNTGQRLWDVIVGTLILGFGIALLGGSLDIFDARSLIIRYWPVLLILVGVRMVLIGGPTDANLISGVFWLVTGTLFFLSVRGTLGVPVRNLIMPLLVIWLGVSMLYAPSGCPAKRKKGDEV